MDISFRCMSPRAAGQPISLMPICCPDLRFAVIYEQLLALRLPDDQLEPVYFVFPGGDNEIQARRKAADVYRNVRQAVLNMKNTFALKVEYSDFCFAPAFCPDVDFILRGVGIYLSMHFPVRLI